VIVSQPVTASLKPRLTIEGVSSDSELVEQSSADRGTLEYGMLIEHVQHVQAVEFGTIPGRRSDVLEHLAMQRCPRGVTHRVSVRLGVDRFTRTVPASAAPTTQRRRIAVIDTAHRRYLLPSSGRAETVRAALYLSRTSRLQELAAVIGGIIARFPN
jgi:hypothetical protein